MVGAIASEELVRRIGTTRVVAAGLVIMTAAMPLVLLWETNTSYLVIGPVVAVIALAVGLVVAPASEGSDERRVREGRCRGRRAAPFEQLGCRSSCWTIEPTYFVRN